MAGGGGISLSQMMEYQLQALAEYRILNGYGSQSAYGGMGTHGILAAEDVSEALSQSLDAITAICFRDGDNDITSDKRVDLADILASDDGTVRIDLSAVYAQALASAADDIALRWMDYLYGYELLEALDKILDPFRDALDSLGAFLRGEETVSGVPYLKRFMESNGVPESDYRFPGSGTTTVTAGGITVTVSNPTADVLDQPWLKDFKERYDREDDYVRDFFNGVVKDGKGYSSASIEVYVPIEETKTEGVMVLDGSLGYIGKAEEPTRILFRDGRITEIEKTPTGLRLKEYMEGYKDSRIYIAGEFGIGLNSYSDCVGNCYIEDESAYGTFHIGLGRNLALGGVQNAKGHFDLVCLNPDIYADNRQIMQYGKIILPEPNVY